MTHFSSTSTYPATPAIHKGELPDLFAMSTGGRITRREQWPACAAAWRDKVVQMLYGGMPPQSRGVEVEKLCLNIRHSWPGQPRNWSCRLHCLGGDRSFSFCARVVAPSGDGPYPAIIDGDSCWWPLETELVQQVLNAGYAMVLFNRTEVAADLGCPGVVDPRRRAGGIYDAYPGGTYGALSAWAWGYHRCVDLLMQLPFIDARRIAVTGHSRGGKAALLAGATDPRIGLVNDNASCAAGSPAFRYVGHGGETLAIVKQFPSWFSPDIHAYIGREDELPFDQHALLAAVAPRPLLLTFALDDRWSNPEGMVQCAWAAGEVYRFLSAPDQLAFHLRPGGHQHAPEDWQVLLDFMGWQWQGRKPSAPYNQHPYRHLQPAFSWKAPQ